MAGEEAQRMAARRAAMEAEVYGGLDFKPQLNRRSLAMAPAGSGGVEALASGRRQRERLEELRQEEADRQRAECTFQARAEAVLAAALAVVRPRPLQPQLLLPVSGWCPTNYALLDHSSAAAGHQQAAGQGIL